MLRCAWEKHSQIAKAKEDSALSISTGAAMMFALVHSKQPSRLMARRHRAQPMFVEPSTLGWTVAGGIGLRMWRCVSSANRKLYE